MRNRRLVIGDIHGNFKALGECLDRAKFSPEHDLLISLGDIVDGHMQSRQVVNYLYGLPSFILILGNHDEWFRDWLHTGSAPRIWTDQGGDATLASYVAATNEEMEMARELLDNAKPHFELGNKLFVHGGYNVTRGIENTPLSMKLWDRDLWSMARLAANARHYTIRPLGKYEEIYIGHTATNHDPLFNKTPGPAHGANVWNLDQGAGWAGHLTIMDIDSKEWWQSDKAEGGR